MFSKLRKINLNALNQQMHIQKELYDPLYDQSKKITIACFCNKKYSKILPINSSFGILVSITVLNQQMIFPLKHPYQAYIKD